MTTRDRNFDDLADHFERKIYQSDKGRLRLALLWQDLVEHLPALNGAQTLRILDAGSGLGQMALRMAKRGHEVVLCDISQHMLALARRDFERELPDVDATFIHAPAQELVHHVAGQFDLILFHAVLEWLADPRETLRQLLPHLHASGTLSLMFYNRDALIFRNLVRGNLRKVKSGDFRGDSRSLTPLQPLGYDEVAGWLAAEGLRIDSLAGIRVFYDYMSRQALEGISYEDLLDMELQFFQQLPYARMGRYLHLLCRADAP